MTKRAIDIRTEELRLLAAEAGAHAIKETLAAGLPVTGTSREYPGISTLYPDGTIVPVPPSECFPAEMAKLKTAGRRKQQAAE